MEREARLAAVGMVGFEAAVTYRVQLAGGFGFPDAAAVTGYLRRLGVTHLYCSPVLQAVPGSSHGYDVVDHSRISADLGGAEGFSVLGAALAQAGLGLVVDVVPNHMGIASRVNRWWWEVLENGPSSLWASFFDIDWSPPETKLHQRVLVPVLADHYGRVLEAGEIRLGREGGSFVICYHHHELPVSPRTLDELLAEAAGLAGSAFLEEVARGFARLPEATQLDRDSVARRHHEKEWLRRRLQTGLDADPVLAKGVDDAVELFNSDPDRLDSLLRRQNYRLAWWKVAGHESDYRRFFDISDLVAVRVEDSTVFDQTHAVLFGMVEEGMVSGLRVDHPDGLRDPQGYLERLAAATGNVWVAVEKILSFGEQLPAGWPVMGTTGYDFANLVGGLFVDPGGEGPLTDFYRDFTGDTDSFEQAAYSARREVLDGSLAAELERLTALSIQVCETRWRYRDFTRPQLRAALAETLAGFDTYRCYVRPDGSHGAEDAARIGAAVRAARRRRPDLDPDLFELLEQVLLLGRRAPAEVELGMRFQQLCAAVTAKGVEDTAFYRYNRLVALNEVGGDPARFGIPPELFHRHNARIARRWPSTMVTTSTHDSKRSEDVRARLALLSEIPDAWREAVVRWSALAERHRTRGRPGRRAEYLLYQTLVGAHPLEADRARRYMQKAVREAKLATSWTAPDEDYEQAVAQLVEGLLGDEEFRQDLEEFARPLVEAGRVNSLAQTVLKLTSPGVADIYQGCEVWNLSLVDPDNRRPVDYSNLAALLEECEDVHDRAGVAGIAAGAERGLPKMFVTHQTLAVRAEHTKAFAPGSSYQPLEVEGPAADHLVGFVRGGRVMALAPRLVLGLASRRGWATTALVLPPGRWVDRFTGARWEGRVTVGGMLAAFPVALLVREARRR